MRSAAQFKRGQLVRAAPVLAVVTVTLLLAAVLGRRASASDLILILALALGIFVLRRPVLGLPVLMLAALFARVELRTGTEVKLNAAFMLVPIMLAIWFLNSVARKRRLLTMHSATLPPLLLFVLAGLLSLLIGTAFWDPNVPRNNNLILAQLTQWAIFAFSAGAFWLTAALVQDIAWLRRLTFLFLVLGGIQVVLRLVPSAGPVLDLYTTTALYWPASIMLLAALGGGQLLYNRSLPRGAAILLALLLGAIGYYAFVTRRADTSVWVGVAVVLGLLIWSRYPRLRWALVLIVVALTAMGVLIPSLYNFAGGDEELALSGNSRLVLIRRVIEVAMRNPITGLGPAAYRSYARMQPLAYMNAYWVQPAVNSHNNYVDLFAHVGILGLGLLGWFAVAYARLGLRLRAHYREGFAAGYLNGILAAGAGALVLMLFADWILPHIYNIGFTGFQASVLLWMFWGGLITLIPQTSAHEASDDRKTP